MAIPETAVRNAQGEIAMRYKQQQRVMVKCGAVYYVFSMQNNICLAWVKEEDVPCILAVKGGCCGEKRAGVIQFATETQARRWQFGGR